MRDDANELEMSLNHAHQNEPSAANVDASELPADLASTQEALTHLANAWSATMPSAARLATFTRRIPSQHAAPPAPDAASALRERPPARHEDGGRQPKHDGGRLLAGLVAAVVLVSLIAATLLKLAPSRTEQGKHATPEAVATAPLLTARAAEEPSQQPPNGAWTTVADTLLIPAPSDGRVVYQAKDDTARVSDDAGATWRELTLPAFSQASVTSKTVSLAVSDANSAIVLLRVMLTLNSAPAADCPVNSTSVPVVAMHGGILASGSNLCEANFASHDGGASWTPAQGFYTAFDQPIVWQVGDALYGLQIDMNRQASLAFPAIGFRLMMSRDQGVTWSTADTTLRTPSRYLCSVQPSAADDALYAVTYTSPCYSAAADAHTHTIWRSADGGATWRQLSTVNALSLSLVASSLTTDGHGLWLYLLENNAPTSSPHTLLVSVDGGVTWQKIPQPPRADSNVPVLPINGALSDGSLVVAVIAQPYAALGRTSGRASFYAWRPGDSAWRPLTTPLTAYYTMYQDLNGGTAIVIAHGGLNALDTLWVMESPGTSVGIHLATHAYPVR